MPNSNREAAYGYWGSKVTLSRTGPHVAVQRSRPNCWPSNCLKPKVKRENQQDATNSMFVSESLIINIELVASCWFSLFTLCSRCTVTRSCHTSSISLHQKNVTVYNQNISCILGAHCTRLRMTGSKLPLPPDVFVTYTVTILPFQRRQSQEANASKFDILTAVLIADWSVHGE